MQGNTELRYEVFERLSRGSMTLNEQDLRNCVYRSPFNDLLAELERDFYWRKAKGGEEPEGRFKEREVILRFFAFANRLSNYAGNLKRFLNEYMGQYAPHEPKDLKTHTALHKQTMQNIYAVFGDKSARLYEVNRGRRHSTYHAKINLPRTSCRGTSGHFQKNCCDRRSRPTGGTCSPFPSAQPTFLRRLNSISWRLP
jgi:hypothetical protein